MDLTHRFTVPTDVETTWAHFQDIAALAQCFPGAQVTSADGDTFAGSCKVKLGPIALVYNGSGTFVEKDDTEHRFVVDAKGKDKRGNGTAGAKVSLSMATADGGGTDVEVLTDLAITGKPAQFGRGVMQDVSDKLLGQFVSCLEQRLGEEAPVADPAGDLTDPGALVDPAAPVDVGAVAAAPDAAVPSDASASTSATADPLPPAAPAPPSTPPRPAPSRPAAAQDDALDLGAAVIPILAKAWWKQGVGVAVVLALVVAVVRRRR